MASEISVEWQTLYNEMRALFRRHELSVDLNITKVEHVMVSSSKLIPSLESSGETNANTLDALRLALERLQGFTSAVALSSGTSQPCHLIFGAVHAIMSHAAPTALREGIGVLKGMTDGLPRFESYMSILADCPQLQLPLKRLYLVYVRSCCAILTASWPSVQARTSLADFFADSANPPAQLRFPTTINAPGIRELSNIFTTAAEVELQARIQHQRQCIGSKLALYPLTCLPKEPDFPETQLPIFMVDMIYDQNFLPRQSTIASMKAFFNSSTPRRTSRRIGSPAPTRQSTSCCVIHGCGGIGKTHTALEFVFTERESFDAIFWVEAAQLSTLAAAYAKIADRLTLNTVHCEKMEQRQSKSVQKPLEWFRNTTHKWLIVFDNVENFNHLHAYLPLKNSNHGSVIITTQTSSFSPITDSFQAIMLTTLEPGEGAELIYRLLQREPEDRQENDEALRISDFLGGLPLALSTAGGVFSDSRLSLSVLSLELRRFDSLIEVGERCFDRPLEMGSSCVFDLSLRALPARAQSLMNIMAFLDPDNVPLDLFVSEEFGNAWCTNTELKGMLDVLHKRHLVRIEESPTGAFLSIHRKMQLNILNNLSRYREDQKIAFSNALELICRCLPSRSLDDRSEPTSWLRFAKYVPQILAMRERALHTSSPVEFTVTFAEVLCRTICFLWYAGLLEQGFEVTKTAERILDKLNITDENCLRGDVHAYYGLITSFCGASRRSEAINHRSKALRSRHVFFAAIPKSYITRRDEVRLYIAESDQAFQLLQVDNYTEAERHIERCLSQYRQWGTESDIPFEYMKYYCIMSYVRMSQNHVVKAIDYAGRAAMLAEMHGGIEHPQTQLSRFCLANLLYFAGEVGIALEINQSILTVRTKLCGEFNSFTLDSHAVIGFLLMKLDRLYDAEKHFKACLDPRKRAVWNIESIARVQYWYSLILSKSGAIEESRKLRSQARNIQGCFLRRYPEYVKPDVDDLVVLDQMTCLWSGRFTGRLVQTRLLPVHMVK